jgi:hypothetical protein
MYAGWGGSGKGVGGIRSHVKNRVADMRQTTDETKGRRRRSQGA